MLDTHSYQFLRLTVIHCSNMQSKTSKKATESDLPQRLTYFDPGQQIATSLKRHCKGNFQRRQ